MTDTFYTIGHSTRSIEEFVDLLNSQQIKLVVDVRTIPRSRTNPQYNEDELAETLLKFQIGYEHISGLGGLRGRSREVAASANAYWKNQSFHNYADYAMTEPFQSALAKLRALGHATVSVVMCAEAVWWRCHRRIIADYLIAAGDTVFHILGIDQITPAVLTPGVRLEAGVLSYPGDPIECKKLAAKV